MSEREITELLRGPEKCLQDVSGAAEVLDRTRLKESLAQALELAQMQNDLEHVELFKNILCNFDHYVKDSVFFTLIK